MSQASAGPLLPEPAPPLLKPAPSQSSWTIELAAPSQPAGSTAQKFPSEIVRFSVEKDGSTIREQAFTQSGEVLERWIVGGREYVLKEDGFVYVPPSDAGTDHFDYSSSNFPGMDWLSLEYYCGPSKHEGVPVHLFVFSDRKQSNVPDVAPLMEECIRQRIPFALLSAKQLPVLYFDGRVLGKFGEFAPMKSRLEVPAALTRMAKQLEEDLKSHRKKPSPP